MKKFIALILIFATLCLVSCDKIKEILNPVSENSASFTVHHDYGFHNTKSATLLMDGAIIFFDNEEWGIGQLVAADKIILTYRGDELLIQESYPATIVTRNVEIVNIRAEYAEIIELEPTADQDGNISLYATDEDIANLTFLRNERYVVSSDYLFSVLDESFIGNKIYASGIRNGNDFEVHALYDFLRVIE